MLEHGALEIALAGALRRAAADGTPLGCLLVDLDGLDAINEREGHRRGDDVLRRAAAVIVRACGEDPVVGRFGGDQFAAAVKTDPVATADPPAGAAAALLDRALGAARAAKRAGCRCVEVT